MEASLSMQLANLNYLRASLDMFQSKFKQEQQVGSSIRTHQVLGGGNKQQVGASNCVSHSCI